MANQYNFQQNFRPLTKKLHIGQKTSTVLLSMIISGVSKVKW